MNHDVPYLPTYIITDQSLLDPSSRTIWPLSTLDADLWVLIGHDPKESSHIACEVWVYRVLSIEESLTARRGEPGR